MADYKKMYALLCGGISDALDMLEAAPAAAPARHLLRERMLEAEELYLSAPYPRAIDGTGLFRLKSDAPRAREE